MKTKNIVLRALTIIFSALMFLPMTLSWVTVTVVSGDYRETKAAKLSDFTKEFLDASDTGEFMTIAMILFYVVFSLAMLLIVLEVVRFFVKNKAVDIVAKLVIIFILILGILTPLFSLMWCSANTKSITVSGYTAGSTFLPWFGGVGILLFSIFICIFGLIDLKKKSKKKKN